jgi:hemoglobin-like flavoprotein
MTPEHTDLVRQSWQLVEPIADQAAALFYDRLFELDPRTQTLFAATNIRMQGTKLMRMLAEVVRQLDCPEELIPAVALLACRHVGYGMKDSDYYTVGEALLWTLEQGLGGAFTPEVRSAWAEAYVLLTAVMRRATSEQLAAHA